MTTEERILSALKKARENDANNRDARRLPSSSAGGAGASTDRAQQALASARQKDKTSSRQLTPSRTPSSTSASPLPSFAMGSGNTIESVLGRFSGRGGIEAIKSPDSWSSAGDAELGLKAWSGQLEGYEKKLTELSGSIANTENRLKNLQTTVKTAEDAAAYDELYAGYERMIADYNGVVNDINRVQDKYSAGVERYRDILSGGMERADAAAAEAKRLEDENSRLQQQANLIRIYEMSGTSSSSAAAPIEAQIEQNAQRIKELQAEESQNKMQYYSSLALMEDYAGLSSPASVTGDSRYEYINDIDNARYRNEHTTDPGGAPVALRRYQYLTEDEIKIYNYLYASQGKDAADRFLEDMGPALTERQGAAQYEELGALGKALYWIPAGLDQFGSGIRQLFQREAVPVSSTQITSQLIQQEAQEKSPVLGTLYTLGTTLSNMAPSILASALGSWALGAAGLSAGTAAAVGRATGAATLGASAGGNAYTQKLNEGYSSEAAQNYATLVGASEGALQYLLGGIGALSKSGTGRIAAKIAALDNALGRVARTVSGSTAARLLGSMISEGTEEGLQELLEPAFAAIIFDEEYEADFEDAAYAFLLGALSAGIIEGPAAIAYARRPAGFSFRDMDGYADNGVDYFEGANTLEEVEARYRDLARQYHPDVGGDTAIMAEINRQRTMARAFFRGRAEAAAEDNTADTTPEAAANTERADGVTRRLTAGRATEETTPETAGAQIENQTGAEAGGIVLPTADSAGDFSPRVEVGETVAPTLEAPRAAAPETNAAGNIVLPTADEIMNGGILNGQQEGRRPAALGGDGGRNADISAGGQAGRLGGSAEVRTAPAEQGRAALARQNSARDLRLQEVSSAELGIPEGTDTRNVRVLPATDWDDALVSTAEQVRSVTGREVRYVLGSIEVRTTAGETRRVRGVWQPSGDIIIQADNLRVSPQQIADHEIYHELAAQNPGLDADVQARIREQFTEEEFGRVVESYIQKLHGIIDLPENASEADFETAMNRVLQEIYADAYAGINAFGARADQFAEPTRATVQERTGVGRENAEATRNKTGPPAERYSYAGTNAANADLEALEVAKGMAEQNVSAETIRQATGWFRGADGKWRFEIDDSGMRYSSRGDLNYGDPDYWRYRELRDKLERDMLGIGSEAVTEAERAEYEELAPRYRDFYLQPGVRGDGSATATRLSDYIQHDELFEQYPQLRDARLVFDELENGERGFYDGTTITLNENLRHAPENTIIHEAQHAIQKYEGFTKGATPDRWEALRNRISRDIAAVQHNLDLWLNDIGYNDFVRDSMRRVAAGDISLDEHWQAVNDFKQNSIYAEEIAKNESQLASLREQLDNISSLGNGNWASALEMYNNTAGEIEARDAAARRKYSKEQRRLTPPDLGNEKTVFAETLGNAERQYDAGEIFPTKSKFSLSEPVEETSDLLALHNLTEDKLLNTLKLGGFPMPSIAVIRDQMPYEEFGDITMVFGRDTIDPQVNSENRIYGGDAWTPTFPQIEYKVNEDELNRIEREVDDLVGGRDIRRQLDRTHSLDVTNVTDDLNRYNGDLATAYRYSNALKYAYLRQLNADYSLPYRYAPLGARSNMDDEIIIQLADMFGIDAIRQMREGGYRYYDSHKEELEKILDLVNQHYRETNNLDENLYDEISFNKWDSLTADIYSYLRQGPKISVDTDAVSKFLADNVNQTEYENWVRNLFNSIVAKRGIRNSKDIFTPSGKRRNFEALHYELTLENVVKAMKNAAQKGGGAVLGGKSIWGVATKDYASVDALKQDKSRLQNISDEKYQEQRQKFTERLHDLASEIANPKANNRLIALDDATETIIEALSKRKTASGINNELRSNKTLNIKNDTAEKALELFKDISNMPVGYFEAKPQRAVPFDEVLAAVVPNDISEELRDGLAKAGIQTIEYDAGDQLDRLAKVESVEGARFSTDEDDDQPVEQAISSAKTSLRQVPALFKDKNVQFGDVNIDIGGGKYDLATEFLAERGTQNLVFDPYNRGEATNRATLDFLRDGSRADTATNANVLNVIAEAPARANVILEMAKAIKPDGKAYFMVYEGDGSGVGRETSAGWQNNRKTADYMDEIERYFDSVERRGKLIIASNPKADLPKALWEVQPGDAVRYSAADDEPRPVIAKQDLRRRLLDTFSVPPGSRAELGRIIEGFADKMIRSGRYTEQDRSALFDKLYDAGAMTLTADPYYSDARGALVKRRMYVSDALKAEFGDDWNDFRKRAFAAGIYLTNNSSDMAPDMWQAELGETLPGLFDSDNLDMRSFMERVVQVAEEGRDEQVSLAEYTQMLAGENYVSEDEVLQDLEQRVDWELRSFAEKADLEVRLRGRGADGITNTERKRIIQEERANYWQLHKQYQEETRRRISEERGKRHASEREAREKINNIIREEREKYWQKRRDYQQRTDERVRQERERRWAVQSETRRRIDDVEQAERRTYYERLERYKEARRATDARERERRKQMSERRRETAELRNLQQRTLKQIQWLAKNQYRAPAELRQQWDEVLGDLDIFAVSAANEMNYSKKYDATWRDLAEMYKKARDSDPNFLPSQELERIVARLDNEKIGNLDIGALQDLYKAAVGLRTEFYNRNHVIGDEEGRLFAELYADSKAEIIEAPGGYTGNPADKVFNIEQLTPMNYLERMAGWNPDSAWYSMAKQLEKGERDERAYIVQANKLLSDWLRDNEDWVMQSDGQGKNAVWYEVEVPELLELGMGDKPVFGDSVKVYMTPSMKVHLYLESKNYDNLRHMVGGRTFPDKELYSDGKRQEAFAQGKTIRLAPETVKKLVSDLTPEEQELAALLERYYNQFAAERINKVSNALYGYDRAVTKNYAPIYTNSNYNQKEIGKSDQTAEGVGNMKQRIRGAKNPSYNLYAYDAFERHVDQTARFVGMAIPARNWKTLLNWRERNNSMSDVITHKWGNESLKYITDLLTDLQGGSPRKAQFQISSFADKLWSNYISAVFGANPSIVLKQLGSIPLGGAYLGMNNVPSPGQIANIDRELISRYTSELDWRLMGYSTPETKQLKDHPNWTERNSFFRNVFGGGAITGMDGWAASTLWPWAENKIRKERPELEVGTQEQIDAGQSPFYKAVAAEFDNAVNRSQSMSDTLHNARIRKSDNAVLRTLTMFKSDAAQTYNAFRQTIGEAQYYKRKGADSKTQRVARAATGAAFLAWIINAAWTAGVNFLVNLAKKKGANYRDDEDELTAHSVLGNIASDMLNGMSGVVILGEELAGAIGSAITGERWYGLDTPGIEQLNDTLESLINSGNSIKRLLGDAINIGQQGGDVLAYLNEHRADLAGGIKEVAATAVTYFPGLPVNNVEAYLAGLLSWTIPSLSTSYEDLFETPDKASLSGLEGDALVTRVENILASRLEDVSEPAAQTVATLYAAGYTEALPSGIPKQVTVTDKKTDTSETVELDAYQQQFFGQVWTETVGRAVDELVLMPEFEAASPEDQAKMLSQIYRFANETAKAETVEKYSPPSTMAEAAEDIASGRTLAEWAAYDVLSDDVSGTFGKLTDEGLDYEQALDVAETLDDLGDDATSVERYLAVARMPLPEDEKELALRGVMTDSAYAKYETARSAGIDTLDYCEFLDRISDISGDGRQERVWALIDSMRLTNRQKDVLHLAAGYKDSTLSKTPWHN